jgi:hypothetical protein
MSNPSALETLLFAALGKQTAAERSAFLDSACAGDAELRRQVEKLLKAQARVGDFLQKPMVDPLLVAEKPTEGTLAFDGSTSREGADLMGKLASISTEPYSPIISPQFSRGFRGILHTLRG